MEIPNHNPLSAPRKIDILVTTRCSGKCRHCFAPKKKLPELSPQDWTSIITDFYTYGVREIVFSGGEPTLYKDLDILLKHSKELGIKTTLSTNGLSDTNTYRKILPYIDEVGISLDSTKEETNMRMGRGESQIERSIQLIKEIQENYSQIELTVRTVITSNNYTQVQEIPNLLKKKDIDWDRIRWKVYEYLPHWRENNKLIVDLMLPLSQIYEYPNLEFFSIDDREPYMLILPNGEVEVTDIMDNLLVERDVGSVLKDGVETVLEQVYLLESEMPSVREN